MAKQVFSEKEGNVFIAAMNNLDFNVQEILEENGDIKAIEKDPCNYHDSVLPEDFFFEFMYENERDLDQAWNVYFMKRENRSFKANQKFRAKDKRRLFAKNYYWGTNPNIDKNVLKKGVIEVEPVMQVHVDGKVPREVTERLYRIIIKTTEFSWAKGYYTNIFDLKGFWKPEDLDFTPRYNYFYKATIEQKTFIVVENGEVVEEKVFDKRVIPKQFTKIELPEEITTVVCPSVDKERDYLYIPYKCKYKFYGKEVTNKNRFIGSMPVFPWRSWGKIDKLDAVRRSAKRNRQRDIDMLEEELREEREEYWRNLYMIDDDFMDDDERYYRDDDYTYLVKPVWSGNFWEEPALSMYEKDIAEQIKHEIRMEESERDYYDHYEWPDYFSDWD